MPGIVPTALTLTKVVLQPDTIGLMVQISPVIPTQPILLQYLKDGVWTDLFMGGTDANGQFLMPFYVNGQLFSQFQGLTFPLLIQAYHMQAPDVNDPTTIYDASTSNILQLSDPRISEEIPWLWLGIGAVAAVGIFWYFGIRKH
jgi:hypothetical protein